MCWISYLSDKHQEPMFFVSKIQKYGMDNSLDSCMALAKVVQCNLDRSHHCEY